MKSATSAALACLWAVARAHPRGHVWVTDTCYPNPGNTDNDCTQMVEDGFDWTDLNPGPFSSYGGLDFSGFTCQDPTGDNDLGKYIEGKLSRGDSSGLEITSGAEQDGFSITDFYLTTSEKTDVDIIYEMPDGSSCRNVASCSPEETHITNEQCGGAVAISFHLPEDSKGDDLDLGIHSIEFNCGPADVPKTTSASTPVIPSATGGSSSSLVPSSSVPVITIAPSTTRMTTSTVYSTTQVTITSCAPTVVSCPADSTTVVTSTIAVSTTVCPVTETETVPATVPSSVAPGSKSSPLIPTAVSTPTGDVPATTPAPSSAAPSGSSPPGGSVTTVITYETVTTCPVTTTITTGGSEIPTTYSTISTVTQTTTSTICTSCATPTDVPAESSPAETTPAPTGVLPGSSSLPGGSVTTVITYETVTTCPVTTTITTGGSEIPTTYSTISTVTQTTTSTLCTQCTPTPNPETPPTTPPTPSSPCPDSVPKCINTWLTLMPKCSSNSDVSCFCPNQAFTSKVIACIRAWGASDQDIQAALSYFTGICSAFVPQNPGIITDIPSTITLVPTIAPTPPPTGVAPPPTPGPVTQPPATVITYSSFTVTVPQVQFTTGAGSTGEVGLVPASTTSSRALFSTLYTAHPSAGPAPAASGSVSVSAEVPLSTGEAARLENGVWAVVVAAVVGLGVVVG